MKITAFIDGFNLYHSLVKNPETEKYRWLNLKKLCQFFIKKSESLTDIYYFTALAKWNEGKIKRHQEYIKALETTNVQVVHENFKRVTKRCRKCYANYKTFEEKETDVNVALYLIKMAFQNKFDKFFLVTGDTDLIPAVKMIKEYFPKKRSHIITPINSRSMSLKDIADSSSKIKKQHLQDSLFPNIIQSDGEILKPKQW
ncbi:MAG: NYN domain-containing protein [Bdellovibrionales bacterium]|nr:NYN domain-containing protein [Bdellovibrionales bacterium]